MKTAIVTFVRAYNHGAVLQCYALHTKLLEMGIENEVLDYYPKYFYDVYHVKHLGELRFFPYRPLRLWVKYTLMFFILKNRIRGFERFIKSNIALSADQYKSTDELNCAELCYDAFIAGSDQVWSYIWNEFDPVFFLDFNSANKAKKWSYAASFGFSKIPDEYRSEYRRRLETFDKLCVRETSGADILEDLIGKKPYVCCDPTLLLTQNEWKRLITNPPPQKPYILIYYVNSSAKMMEYGEKLASIKNMSVFSVTSIASYDDIVGRTAQSHHVHHKGACPPDEFLSLISGAEYVLTDSFHGTVFSIIFHKQFLTRCDLGKGRTNNRAVDLMNLLQIKNRQLTDDLSLIDNTIEWDLVDKRLQAYRQSSLDYISALKYDSSVETSNEEGVD